LSWDDSLPRICCPSTRCGSRLLVGTRNVHHPATERPPLGVHQADPVLGPPVEFRLSRGIKKRTCFCSIFPVRRWLRGNGSTFSSRKCRHYGSPGGSTWTRRVSVSGTSRAWVCADAAETGFEEQVLRGMRKALTHVAIICEDATLQPTTHPLRPQPHLHPITTPTFTSIRTPTSTSSFTSTSLSA